MTPPRNADPRWMLGVGLVAGACGGQELGSTGQPDGLGGAGGGGTVLAPEAGVEPTPTAVPTFVPPDPDPFPETCAPGSLADVGPVGPFDAFAVSHGDVGRRVIYSWTSAEQIAELRADPTLLTRSITADGQRGRAADYILSIAAVDEMAAILARPEFEKKRFGWTNPWATLLGWVDETYGNELLEIRLRPESWIGRLDAETGEWAFFDVNNAPVDLETVKASPERIAAVYFMDGTHSQMCAGGTLGTFGAGPAFREYFVCNEAMVEGWSAYTVEIRAELERGIAALQELRSELAARGCVDPGEDESCWRERVVQIWQRAPVTLVEGYEASLAFPNSLYMPIASNLDALISLLEAELFEPMPLVHQNP